MKRLAFMASCMVLGACGFEVSGGASIDASGNADDLADAGPDIDAPPDTSIEPPDTMMEDGCIGGDLAQVCFASPPTGQMTFANTEFVDTGNASNCTATTNAAAAGWCVIAAANITVNAGITVRGFGGKPLVLVATGTITVNGTVDVASRLLLSGAGRNAAACVAGTPASGGNSGGGGYGGSFGGRGGNGGTNDGGTGGTPPLAVTGTLALRGGCAGGTGGLASGNDSQGGDGGGAVALIAGTSITLGSDAAINASGAGGRASLVVVRQGGGGGGSGGMILLEAPAISATGATLYANGGGGAEGNGQSPGDQGGDVTDPSSSAAGGENGSNSGGDGGDGSLGGAGFAAVANASPSGGGGGGGGGGTGVIHATVALTGATVSPARTP